MAGFDAAATAVDAALAAGARYADARVMYRRVESMAARNGNVEDLTQTEDEGVGVRALVGSSLGFFALPDLSDAAASTAGGRVAEIAHASAVVAGPSPGAVLGIAGEAVMVPTQFGWFAFSAPAVRLASWHFTGGASG